MAEKIDGLYTEFHKQRLGIHCYPNEFLVRTMLGTYPTLTISHDYQGKKALDWSCGDGRNIPLLFNLGFEVYATEITQEIVEGVSQRMHSFGLDPIIRVGRNSNMPFADDYFDYIIASSSLYYVDHGSDFSSNHKELARVLCSGGFAIVTLPHPDTFILKDSIYMGEGHYQITNDPYGLRNGDIFRVFVDENDIRNEFESDFEDICIGMQSEDYYGMHIQLWLVVMRRKS